MFLANKLNKGAGAPTPKDAQFNYVTMLLHGDGTNGAQNNTFLDSSTNAFSITRNGNTTQGSFSPYGSNWSNYFDGSGDYLATSSTQIIPATTTYTVEAWVYLTGDYSDYREIVTQGSSGNANRWLMLVNITDGILIFQTGSTGISTSFTVPRNTWTHLAFVNNSGSYTVYANGTSVGSGTNTVTPQNTYVTVGAFQSGAEYFQGYISNVRITNTAVYTSAFTPSTTPLTAISGTSFLTCQSNRFIDNSANTYAITANGNTSVQRFNPFGTATAYSTSVIGGSGYFDGSGDYLVIPNGGGSALDMGTGNCTIEMWVYPDTQVESFPSMFAPKTGFSTGTFYIRYQGSKFGIYWSGVGDPFFQSASTYPPNSWYHVAVVRSGTTFTLYVNGVSAGTGTSSATLDLAVGGEVWLGNNTSASCEYKGFLTNVRVVKGTAVYTAAFTPPTSPLTAISGTSLLVNMTNGAIFDNAMMNDLETVGNAQISTSVVKYGTGSLAFDGTGDYLYVPNFVTNQLRTADYTVEFWVYGTSWSTTPVILEYGRGPGPNGFGLEFYISTTGGKLDVYGGASTGTLLASYSSLSTGSWIHVALTRASGTTRLFINGTQSGSSVTDNTDYTSAYVTLGAWYNGTLTFNGYIDDFRITKGYARYTANFTPPTAALPDTGPV